MHPLLADPWIAARIDAALGPFLGRLSAEEWSFAREQLAEMLVAEEGPRRMLSGARPRDVSESGEAVIDGALLHAGRARVGGGK
jgi:hypothetical protein